jgi:hypothetical protein
MALKMAAAVVENSIGGGFPLPVSATAVRLDDCMSSETSPTAVLVAYQPPALVVLGSVSELTLGNNGSLLDNNGRGSHGKIK